MKQLNPQQIQHINKVLEKLEGIIIDHNKPENRVDFDMLYSELLLSNPNWSDRFLFSSLHSMKFLKKGYNYEELDKLCRNSIERSRKIQTIKYYVPVNYHLGEQIQLNSVKIKKVTNRNKHNSIVKSINGYRVNSKYYGFDFDLLNDDSYYFLEFTVSGLEYDICYKEFYSTFLLLRGIIEYCHSKYIYTFKYGRHYPKESNKIIHPPFVYIESTFYNKDLHFFKNRQTKYVTNKSIGSEEISKVSELIEILKIRSDENSTKFLLSNCLRLYSLGVDSPTWEHTFLYFWNILDEITLSQKTRGLTQKVIERCKRFTNDDFINLYENKIYSLSNIRNNLVHRGINDVTDTDVGILKLLCVNNLDFIIEEIESIKYIEQLEIVYETKNISIESLKRRRDIIDTIITRRTLDKKKKNSDME